MPEYKPARFRRMLAWFLDMGICLMLPGRLVTSLPLSANVQIFAAAFAIFGGFELYAETGDYQKAEKDYLFLRHLTPTSWDVVLELARLYHQMNRTREALELLEPCTKISPKDKTLEQKSVLLEIREQYQAMDKKRGCEQ